MNSSQSQSELLKTELSSIEVKRQCCRRALVFGLLFAAERLENGDVVLSVPPCVGELACRLIREQFTREPKLLGAYRGKLRFGFNSKSARIMLEELDQFRTRVKCGDCASTMLRGVFLAVGSMNSPEKESYLQLSPTSDKACLAAKEIAEECGVAFSVGERRGKSYLYIKRRQSIEDMLGTVGANSAYFDFINAGIDKQTREYANRSANCITSNISKTVSSSMQLVELINEARDEDRLSVLPPELAETAKLRSKYEDSSLAQLAAMHNPPVSKSGLYHRLDKIKMILEDDAKRRNKIKK
ncbi:MAG: DNA-binding protein WhiA [Clostridia bacterium]|nr:DNA-binding protein WhiA [Clostridia bacterium]